MEAVELGNWPNGNALQVRLTTTAVDMLEALQSFDGVRLALITNTEANYGAGRAQQTGGEALFRVRPGALTRFGSNYLRLSAPLYVALPGSFNVREAVVSVHVPGLDAGRQVAELYITADGRLSAAGVNPTVLLYKRA